MTTNPLTIDLLMKDFEAGNFPGVLERLSDQIDFRIDHFQDSLDVSWQVAKNKQELVGVLGRLTQEVFPRGTKIMDLKSKDLGNGWALSEFQQEFFYGVLQKIVTSKTIILSHSKNDKCDYFRETVVDVVPK